MLLTRAETLKQQFTDSLGLPWQEILPASRLDVILEEEGVHYRNCVYTPVVTLWAWMTQVLDADKSLSNAVKRIIAWVSVAGLPSPSPDTGAYCKARKRLSETLISGLVAETAETLEQQVFCLQQWCGHRVRVFDGTSILMNDTVANQTAYPQHSNQRPGCGFPIIQVVVVFSLVTGAVVQAAIAPFRTSEIVLSRALYKLLEAGDVVLADQAYGSYTDLALIQLQGADGVLRKHHARKTDFRRGQRLGKGDHCVVWNKPSECPNHMSPEEFDTLPNTLQVREVKVQVKRPGYRSQTIIVVTTLLNANFYTAERLGQLYLMRWSAAEVNLRYLKTLLKMDMLNAKTPQMVRKDLWAHLLAYNLLRALIGKVSQLSGFSVFRLSMQGTRQQLMQMLPLLATTTTPARMNLFEQLLVSIARDLLPIRPHRCEPRVVKRRPKPFPLMRQPRATLKAKLAA